LACETVAEYRGERPHRGAWSGAAPRLNWASRQGGSPIRHAGGVTSRPPLEELAVESMVVGAGRRRPGPSRLRPWLVRGTGRGPGAALGVAVARLRAWLRAALCPSPRLRRRRTAKRRSSCSVERRWVVSGTGRTTEGRRRPSLARAARPLPRTAGLAWDRAVDADRVARRAAAHPPPPAAAPQRHLGPPPVGALRFTGPPLAICRLTRHRRWDASCMEWSGAPC